uniref:Uncharacterized protein n=1 Tax=Oryza glumipatula TaxID=40148 RepID=A0A0D9YHJ5_9ORYZ
MGARGLQLLHMENKQEDGKVLSYLVAKILWLALLLKKYGELVALTAHFDTCESTLYNKGCDGLERTKLDKNMHETMEVQSWPHVGITKMPRHLTQCQMQAQAQISDNVAFE